MNNKQLITITLLLLTPLFLFIGCKGKNKQNQKEERTKQWVSSIEKSLSPAETLKSEILAVDTIIISENPGYYENILFLEYLIPLLYDSDITNMGVWFLEASEQKKIDTFLKGNETFQDALQILSKGSPMANYDEYANFLLLVSQFNKNLEKDEPLFRLIGLSEKGAISHNGLQSLNRERVSEEPTKDSTESPENEVIDNPKINESQKAIFIWWKREEIASFKLSNKNSSLFFLHAPPNRNLPVSESAVKEAILFERAAHTISPFDRIKAVPFDSVKDLITHSVVWDWYILTGPASEFTPLKSSSETNKEISSQLESDLKKFKKEL